MRQLRELHREVCRQRYDVIAMLWTGSHLHRNLKIFAFLCLPRRLLAVNENGDSFYVHRSETAVLRAHRQWRRRHNRATGDLSDRALGLVRLLFFPLLALLTLIFLVGMASCFQQRCVRRWITGLVRSGSFSDSGPC